MVVLQLAASQFSPRILRTFSSDRLTQVTIGTYVGTFVYAILVLRAVGSFGDAGFVPRLSVTVASLLGIAAVILLVVFLNHVVQLIQVSHVTANITRETLARVEELYPEKFGAPAVDEDADELLASWRQEPSGHVMGVRPGYVQRVGLDDLVAGIAGQVDRVAVLVRPGDFVSVEMPVVEVWPPEAAEECGEALRGAIAIGSERDISQDVHFGLRQLDRHGAQGDVPGDQRPDDRGDLHQLPAIEPRAPDRASRSARRPSASRTTTSRRSWRSGGTRSTSRCSCRSTGTWRATPGWRARCWWRSAPAPRSRGTTRPRIA